MKHVRSMFTSLALALSLCCVRVALGDVFALPDGLTQLKGQSYSLRARVSSTVGGKPYVVELDEYFSPWQRRSRIDYKMRSRGASDWLDDDKIPKKGTVLADERNVLLLRERASGGYCARLSHQLALKMFTMGALDDEQVEPQNLIGPSRFLHFIADRVYKLILIDESKTLPRETFKAIPKRVKLVFNELANGAKLSLFYSNNLANNLAYGVPQEMHLQLTNQTLVIYEFLTVTILNLNGFIDRRSTFMAANKLRFQHATIDPGASELALDLFSWPRRIGCSKALRKSQLDDRLDLVGLNRREYRFSFTAQTGADSTETIVGYEPTISTLRVNKISKDETIESTTNYQQMRNYHVLRKHNGKVNEFEAVFGDSQRSDAGGGKISCVMTQATATSARDPLLRGLKLGDMLLGSIKFTYLGRAKVRGIDALMFESPDSEWPIWLESPAMIYKSDNLKSTATKQTISRPAGGFMSDNECQLTTVIYLSASSTGGQDEARGKSDYQEPIALDNKLLLIEFYEFHKKSNKLLRTDSAAIYDFAWHIVNGGIGNRRYVDFFAIADDCPRDDNSVKNQARVDLVLAIDHGAGSANKSITKLDGETGNELTDGWLLDDIKRDLAIMQAFNCYVNLHASLIYDFQSRLGSNFNSRSRTTGEKGTEISRLADGTQVAISFRMVDHVRHLDELVYFGLGCIKMNAYMKFHQFRVKFRDCSLLAAHNKLETVFGFDSALDRCYVYVGRVAGPASTLLIGSTFDMERADCSPKLEIYKTSRELDEGDKLSAFKFNSLKRISLFPVFDDGSEDARAGDPVWYNAENIQTRLSEPSQATTSSVDLNGQSRHLPFGLVPTSPMNTLIATNRDHSEFDTPKQRTWAEAHFRQPLDALTFGQCQFQCLVSLECDAFSVCHRAGQFECVLTRANLRSESSLRRLNEVAIDKNITLGQIFEVDSSRESGSDDDAEVNKSRVALRKHPACELHFKDYMVLTQRRNVAKVSWAHDLARLKPVRDREECAQRCLQRTITTLKEDVEPLSRLNEEALKRLDQDGNKLRQLYQQHRATHLKLCYSFLYLDIQDCDAILIDRLHGIHAETYTHETKLNGFCSITGEESLIGHKEMDMVGFGVVSEKHQMDFSAMYDKLFGISLLGSTMSAEEKAAIDAVTHIDDHSAPLTPEDQKVLRAFVDRGENHAAYFHSTEDVTACARVCFMDQPVWPACKSFSVEEAFSKETGKHTLTCRLNSVTLSEVLANERYDLIREQKSPVDTRNQTIKANPTILYWHYEPKPNLIGRSVDWESGLKIDFDLRAASRLSAGNSTLHMGPLWLLAFVFATLVLGIKLGVHLGKRFNMNLGTTREDSENLVNGIVVDNSDLLASGVSIGFKGLATCYEEPENEAKAEQERESSR